MRIARSRGLLWDETHAINFVLQVTQRESMLLELARHKFPALHANLRVAARPSSSQSAELRTSTTMLPPQKGGASMMELVPPSALAGAGGSSSDFRIAAAPRPSVVAAAAAAAAAIVAAPNEAVKKRGRRGAKGAGARVDEPKGRDTRDVADRRNVAKKAKRQAARGAPKDSAGGGKNGTS